ncbi:hypothetical protein MTR67_030610, partial [Solanum verrucosum]
FCSLVMAFGSWGGRVKDLFLESDLYGFVVVVISLSPLILLYSYGMRRPVNCRNEVWQNAWSPVSECLVSCFGSEIQMVW